LLFRNLAPDVANSPRTIISYLDPVKRLEAYLAAGDCRFLPSAEY
jgi:hypothetical protein